MSEYEQLVIDLLCRLFDSSILAASTSIGVLASTILIFANSSAVMYGVEHGINLIAYWHIPLATVAGVALTVTFVGCALYLLTGTQFWERIAHASGEVGFIFVTLTLVTGSLWGRVIWNTWWDWSDIRLVTFLFIWFIYAGYLVIYSSASGTGRVSRLASVYGVVGFVTVPISYVSTRLWTARLHTPSIGNPETDATITASTLIVSLLALFLLYVFLVGLRVRLHTLVDRLDAVRDRTRRETHFPTEME